MSEASGIPRGSQEEKGDYIRRLYGIIEGCNEYIKYEGFMPSTNEALGEQIASIQQRCGEFMRERDELQARVVSLNNKLMNVTESLTAEMTKRFRAERNLATAMGVRPKVGEVVEALDASQLHVDGLVVIDEGSEVAQWNEESDGWLVVGMMEPVGDDQLNFPVVVLSVPPVVLPS